jgi:hypothetical protein
MDYAKTLKSILESHARLNPSHGKIETYAAFDDQQQTYCVFDAGWDDGHRVRGLMFAGRIVDGKITIEYDGLHHGITEELIQAGVPEDDIIHAWRLPCPPEGGKRTASSHASSAPTATVAN